MPTSGLLQSTASAAHPRRKVRVLFINDTARNGGPGRSLHSILKFLDPAVVHRAVVLPRNGAIAALLSADGVADELHFMPDLVENPIEPWDRPIERRDFDAPVALRLARMAGNGFKATRAVARLIQLTRNGRFDLIYCNGSSAEFAGGAVAAMTGVPALWHVRYTSVPPAVAGLHRRLSAGRGVRRLVCVSRAAAELFQHCADKVTVVHNALDVDHFNPASVRATLRTELGLRSDDIVFGSHGRVLRRKGVVELVRAARIVLDRTSEPERGRIAFAIVGDTPEDFRPDHVDECRALATELGIHEQFHMLGFREDVRPLVADFDVAVVPSVYADPLPRAVIESMALGKPVIAFDVGGVVEMIEDGVTGSLVHFEPVEGSAEGASANAVERLAGAMLRYASSAELRVEQGRAARNRIERDFDARAHARRIESEIVKASRS
ncbi:MAG: glycosyltransferase [Myxococcota bacterium]|nr:glycosyltransferase [Myxococcota bacterium]